MHMYKKRIHKISWFPTLKLFRADIAPNVFFSQYLAKEAQVQEEVGYMGLLGCLLGLTVLSLLRKHAVISITHPHLDHNLSFQELEYLH